MIGLFCFGDRKTFGYVSETVNLVRKGVVRVHLAPRGRQLTERKKQEKELRHTTDKALVESKREVNLGGCMPSTTVCTKTLLKDDNGWRVVDQCRLWEESVVDEEPVLKTGRSGKTDLWVRIPLLPLIESNLAWR
jgi:hypothetical protein